MIKLLNKLWFISEPIGTRRKWTQSWAQKMLFYSIKRIVTNSTFWSFAHLLCCVFYLEISINPLEQKQEYLWRVKWFKHILSLGPNSELDELKKMLISYVRVRFSNLAFVLYTYTLTMILLVSILQSKNIVVIK